MNGFLQPRTLTRSELGALGERHAARLLRARGLRVLEGNYRTPQGELDIIARDGEVLVIVEVRTRSSADSVSPLESVDAQKRAQLVRMAQRYCRDRRLSDCPCRFDIVEVEATLDGRIVNIQHLPGAFLDGDEE